MIQEPANSNMLSNTLGTLFRVNDIQKNMSTYSPSKCVRLFRRLFESSVLATALTIVLVFGLIQESAGSAQISARTDVTTTYSSAWTGNSPTFSRHVDQMAKHYYYEPLQVSVSMAGTYTFISNSPINTYAYLYNDEFKSTDPPLKLMSQDDDSNGQGQFKITAILQPGQKYILVATTFSPDTKGAFSILSSGPATIDMHSTIVSTKSVNEIVPSALRSISSTFSDYLSSSSPVFNRPSGSSPNYYYQAIQVGVSTYGTYTFTSSSSIDTYGCLYSGSFNPSYPSRNLITCDDDSGSGNQFLISYTLGSGSTYILIVTTFGSSETGYFTITAVGLDYANMNSYNPQASTTPSVTNPTYFGSFTGRSPVYTRPSGSSSSYYYYQALTMTIYSTGTYIFISNSSIDTYGYLYEYSFDPSYPSYNFLTSDDDSAGSGQFRIEANLRSGYTYILVVTTYSPSATGSYSIRGFGQGTFRLIPFTPTTSRPITVSTYRSYNRNDSSDIAKILGITFGSIALFVIILAIIIHQVKKTKTSSQQTIASRNNQSVRPQNVPMSYVYTNAPRPNGSSAPYTISMHAPGVTFGEAPPPTYDTYLSSLKPQQ